MNTRSKQSYIDCGLKGAKVRWDKEPPYAVRFWRNVQIGRPDECWPWKKSLNSQTGYGKYKKGKLHTNSHRIAFELTYGPIPKGGHICHRCDNRPCCNPAHLFCGSHQDNMKDMVNKGRQYHPGIGEKHHNATITDETVRQARRLYTTGLSQRKIAELLEVNRHTIQGVLSGKQWTHVV